MEHKQFTSDDLSISPQSSQGFQADRFTKKTSQLNIPDTILENCSAEMSGDSLKTEVPKIMLESFNSDDKENNSCNQQIICNDFLNNSTNITLDNSYIKRCERKLLETNYSDDEENNEVVNKSLVNNQLLKVSRKYNDTISTPPSLLRKEINMLRTEMAEAHEFHDLEIQLLKEEKFLSQVDTENNAELLEKYSTLMELYTALKNSYDEYRKAQEKMGRELQSKTADCLETLCSQIEASDNSLNLSTASFMSFNGGIRSSTMLEDISEVEATVVHEATVLANDPLSITQDTFKTPMQTPSRSVKALFQQVPSSTTKPAIKEVKEILADTTTPFESENNLQLLNLETALYDKISEVTDLEQRLFKVEDMSVALQNEFERISSVYSIENNALKESLSAKTEQLNEITQKLFTETVSLNPSLRDSLVDAPGKKLLPVFLETIMESCKKIRIEGMPPIVEDLRKQLASQEGKLAELDDLRKNLETKLSVAENTLLTRDEELRLLQSHLSNVRQTKEDLASTKNALSEVESRLTLEEAKKNAAENRCLELEELIKNLNRDVDTNEKLRAELQSQLSSAEEEKSQMKTENSRLNELYTALQLQMDERENLLKFNELEMITIKESLTSAEETVEKLKSQLTTMEEEKSSLQNQCSELQGTIQNLQTEMKNYDNLETLQKETENLKQKVSESEEVIIELKKSLEVAEEQKVLETQEKTKDFEQLQTEYDDLKQKVVETQVTLEETKKNSEKRCLELEELIEKLKLDIETNEKLREELQSRLSSTEEEKSEMQTENSHLKESYAALQLQMDEKEKTVQSNESEVITMKERLTSADETIEKLKSQLTVVEEEKSRLQNEYRELQDTIQKLQSEMKNFDNFEQIQAENAELTRKVMEFQLSLEETKKNAENRCFELEEFIKKLNSKIEVNENLCEQLKTRLSSTEEKRTEIENEHCRLKESYNALQLQMADREETLKSNESEMTTVKESLTSAEETVQKLKSELTAIEEEKSSLQNQCTEMQDTIEKLLTEMKNADNIDQLQSEIQDLKQKVTESQLTLEETKKNAEDKCFELEELIKELNSKIETNEKLRAELQDRLSSAEEERSEMQTENSRLKESYTALQVQMDESDKIQKSNESEMVTIKESLTSAEETVEKLKSQLTTIEEEKLNLQNRCSELMDTNQKFLNEIKSYDNIDQLQIQIEDLKQKVVESEEVIIELKKSLEVAKEEQTLRELSEKDARNEIDLLKKEKEELVELTHRLGELEKNNKNLMKAVTEMQNHLDMPDNTLSKILSGELDANKIFIERINRMVKSQMESLELENGHLKDERSEMQTENSRLNEWCTALQLQMDERENILKSNESEMIRIKEILTSTEETVEKLQSQLTAIEEEKSSLQNQCSELLETNQKLLTEIKNMDVIERLQTEIEDLKQKLVESQAAVEETKKSAEDKCFELEELIGKMKLDIDTNEKLREELQIRLSSAEEERSEMEIEHSSLKESYTALQLLMDEREKVLKSNESDMITIKESLTSAEETVEKLKSQLTAIEEEKSGLQNQCSELLDTNQKLLNEIKSFDNIEELQTEIENLKQKVVESEEVIVELKKTLDVAKEEQTLKENSIKDAQNEIDLLKKEKEELMELTPRLGELENNNKTLMEAVKEMQNHLDMPDNTLSKILSGELDGNKIFSERISSMIKNQMQGLKSENEHLREGRSDMENENCRLKELYTALQLQMDEREKVLKSNEFEINTVKEFLTSAEETVDKLKSQLSTIEEEKSSLQNQCSELLETNQKLLTEMKNFDTFEQLQTENADLKQKVVESQLALEETKKNAENKCSELEELIKNLNRDVDTKEKLREELQTRLSSAEDERTEMRTENYRLKESYTALQLQMDEREKVLKSNECEIVTIREVVIELKRSLEVAKEEQTLKELRIKDTQNEINLLKKEKEELVELTEKLGKLEKNNKNLMEAVAEVQNRLDMPDNTLSKILSGELDVNKIFSERINSMIKNHMEGLKSENQHLKLGNDSLKEKVKQLTKLIGETAAEGKEELSSLNISNSFSLRSKAGRKSDLCVRRLDKLEEINHNLTELITRVLAMTEYPDTDKLKLYSVREFPNLMKKVVAHMNGLEAKMKEVKEENAQLDEECETYAKIIKDLKKEAATVWKTNKEKTEEMEAKLNLLTEEKKALEDEKTDLLAKISKLDAEVQKLKSSKTEETPHNCVCGKDSKKINELKRLILVKEQKLLELQDLEAQTNSYKSQIEYLKNALEREKKKIGEEKEKNKKLQNELNEATKKQKSEEKSEENEVLDELRMRGSLSGGIVQEFVDKEKMRKLAKDIAILKELCRARYAEIKRLEAVNAALRNSTPKNSNQMDSPIRTRGYNTRSKVQNRELWKSEAAGKENSAV